MWGANRAWQAHAVRVDFVRAGARASESCTVGPDGYFFIPLDSEEEGRLAVRAPAGWVFDTAEKQVKCATQETDFFFRGVRVEGLARCAGCGSGRGAANVTVGLGEQSAVSDGSGRFVFEAVAPGETVMRVARGGWRQEAAVTVSWEGQLSGHEQLVLPGFAVSGKAAPGVTVRIGDQQTTADAAGEWRFDAVPAGEYSASASLSKEGREWVPEPESITVTVGEGDVVVPQAFEVSRFAVSGTTLPGAAVSVDGERAVESDGEGRFRLFVRSAQRVRVSAEKEGYVFPEVVFDSSMSTVPPLLPSAFRLCVLLDALPETAGITVTVAGESKPGKPQQQACFAVPSGMHVVSVSGGGQFDLVEPVVVADAPPSLVRLRQTRSPLSGRVQLLAPGLSVADVRVLLDGRRSASLQSDLSFRFEEVLPGNHSVAISGGPWCWQREAVSASQSPVLFVQRGYLLRHECAASSPSLSPKSLSVGGLEQSFPCGNAPLCVAPSVWPSALITVRPVGCLRFDPAEQSVDASSAAVQSVRFEPRAWRVWGTVAGGAATLLLSSGQQVKVASDGSFETEASLSEGLALQCRATSASQLCFPSAVNFAAPLTECVAPVAFAVRDGTFVRGRTVPPRAGVEVSVACREDGVATDHSAVTLADGTYALGPLRGECGAVSGSLAMHSVQPSPEDAATLLLLQLSELRVQIEDAKARRGVADCVLSLSGPAGFRENTLSLADGSFVFSQLAPGEYFLRPLLKEYLFEPGQVSVTLEPGVPRTVTVAATRTAYSVMGSVVGLNKEPEKLVTVAALHADSGAVAAEGRTDDKGAFRVRGLQPGQSYRVVTRDERLERTAPAEVAVTMGREDVAGVVFVAVRAVPRVELAGAVHSEAPPGTLFVQLLLEGSVVRSSNRSAYFDFRDLPPSSSYQLLVWSDISDRAHLHEPVVLSLDLSLGALPHRRLFVPVRLAVRERSEAASAAHDGSPAVGAALLIVLAAAFVFRAQLLAVAGPLLGARGDKAAAAAAFAAIARPPGDRQSFLEGTTAQAKKKR